MVDLNGKLERALEVKIISLERKYSKRNNVYLAEVITSHNIIKKFIVKEYEGQSAGNEIFILHMLKQHGLRVPQITWYDNKILVMEYIHGLLLAELLVDQGPDQELWVNALAGWLHELHGCMKIYKKNPFEQTCLCMADLNLRNFIFDSRVFYGIDFEDVCFYPPERDLGVICAFILNNDPMFTSWKYSICSSLISCYDKMFDDESVSRLNPGLIWYYLIEELKAAAERREPQRELLNAYIKELNYNSIFNY
ncbi:MAG: Phosphotransferase enzyme family protein [Pelotomaculum sp. PtaB.Bin104]|nr:MAG: Phosphotransferase enzyme family protein [Pelotomaculum sp. PtaB.Bin104]